MTSIDIYPKRDLPEHTDYAIAKKMIDSLLGEVTLDNADQLNLECRCTDIVQTSVDYCNSNYLKNFQLRLVMEEMPAK